MDQKKANTNRNPIPAKELAVFCHQLSVILSSDITILEGVKMLSEQTTEKQLKCALTKIHEDMSTSSSTFSAAVANQKNVFPSYFINLIAIGEQSGALDDTLMKMSEYYAKESKVRRKVRTAVTYPAVLGILMLGVILLLLMKVLPMFNDTLTSVGGELPPITKGVMDIGNFFVNNGLLVLGILAVIIAVVLLFHHTSYGRRLWDRFVLWLPVSRHVLIRTTTARFARGLGIQLSAGISLNSALDKVDTLVSNTSIISKFEKCRKEVQNGADLYNALLNMKLFTPLFMRMILIGQKTGNLDLMLNKAAALFDEEVDSSLDKLVTSVEPILIIILSVIVGVILISVMLPMINIISSIG